MATLTPYNIYLIPDLPSIKENLKAIGAEKFKRLKSDEARHQIGVEYLIGCTPYVPYDTGRLIDSGTVWNDGTIAWTARNHRNNFHYAGYVYDPNNHLNYTSPKAGPKWDEIFEASPEYEDFMNKTAEILVAAWEKG